MPRLHCPHCGAAEIGRSRRRGLVDHFLSLFGLFPYRCSGCRHRFRLVGNEKHDSPAPQTPVVE